MSHSTSHSTSHSVNPLHPVLMLVYNTTSAQLDLTRKSIASVLAQDIGPLDFRVEDDGSSQETEDWLAAEGWREFPCHPDTRFTWYRRPRNESPIAILNELFARVFQSFPYVLIVNNDAIIPANTYSQFLRWPRGIVCATDIGQQDLPAETCEAKPVAEIMPMTVSLLRRWAWEAVLARDGYFFDEGFFCYAADCDLALRVTACGIRGLMLDLPFYHYGSGSHRLATEEVSRAINETADRDRARFARKYGFPVDSWQYGQIVHDLNLR